MLEIFIVVLIIAGAGWGLTRKKSVKLLPSPEPSYWQAQSEAGDAILAYCRFALEGSKDELHKRIRQEISEAYRAGPDINEAQQRRLSFLTAATPLEREITG